MPKLRVLLDEDVRVDVKDAFPAKIQVNTVAELALSGKADTYVIEEAIARKSLIVTANKDFVPQYRNHE
jgi:predicted nuclease of predicted toxin-antitoxin system